MKFYYTRFTTIQKNQPRKNQVKKSSGGGKGKNSKDFLQDQPQPSPKNGTPQRHGLGPRGEPWWSIQILVASSTNMGVEPKNRGIFPPKWMVKIMENPMNKWMIWGVFPLFLGWHPNISKRGATWSIHRRICGIFWPAGDSMVVKTQKKRPAGYEKQL